jgi:hypothetical protein
MTTNIYLVKKNFPYAKLGDPPAFKLTELNRAFSEAGLRNLASQNVVYVLSFDEQSGELTLGRMEEK